MRLRAVGVSPRTLFLLLRFLRILRVHRRLHLLRGLRLTSRLRLLVRVLWRQGDPD